MVTITSTVSDHSEPSLISAIATTFCESASLIRVEKAARPARGPRCTEMISGCGKAAFSTRIRLADSQNVVAIAELNDGSLWSDTVEVIVTIAACLEYN